ncbi:MAG: hypothetical protein L0M06_16310 [Enterococcus sp.]|uniref:hypothetical protein n=1 Tax=Enterococcus sp. TaxID=35783 RepID=UPI002648030C|nr:hypothetical protein [Enterococcus sp.]MDN6003568.1 hypothetical protein [Enterococcus sp.]MDN6562325.1 hypothetical protein [Enterococcus sp.]MDN6778117.1 hypothetical protein [Enterococcus sp.]
METIPTIDDLEIYKMSGEHPVNQQVVYRFDNGFGASVILGKFTYGLEMMLLTPNTGMDDKYVKEQLLELESDLYYDVVGHMSEPRMEFLLKGIKALKSYREVEDGE